MMSPPQAECTEMHFFFGSANALSSIRLAEKLEEWGYGTCVREFGIRATAQFAQASDVDADLLNRMTTLADSVDCTFEGHDTESVRPL
jgi:hypothetical protein